MNPFRHIMAAHLGKISGTLGAVIAAAIVYREVVGGVPDGVIAGFGFALAMLCALAVGFLLGFMTIGRILFLICSRLNGSPLKNGDTVRILCGPHRGRVTQVYDVWGPRGELRVDLGEQAKKDVKDVLMFHQVCREK